jgi:hypothetical protein
MTVLRTRFKGHTDTVVYRNAEEARQTLELDAAQYDLWILDNGLIVDAGGAQVGSWEIT